MENIFTKPRAYKNCNSSETIIIPTNITTNITPNNTSQNSNNLIKTCIVS